MADAVEEAMANSDFDNAEGQQEGVETTQAEHLPRDIGGSGMWTLSSCKSGFGLHQLRDPNTGYYWQSDGPQPHLVTVEFLQKTAIAACSFHVDFTLDESYTPMTLSIRLGSHHHDLREVKVVELEETAQGWRKVSLAAPNRPYRKAFVFQLAVVANHQNGRDTHLRALQIHPPEQESRTLTEGTVLNNDTFLNFASTIR